MTENGVARSFYHDVKALSFVNTVSVSEAPQREQRGTRVLHLQARKAPLGVRMPRGHSQLCADRELKRVQWL